MFLSPLVIGTSSSRPLKRSTNGNGISADDSMASGQPFPVPHWGSDVTSGASELTTGATIGVVIGTIVAFAVLAAVIWASVRWRRRRRQGSFGDVYPSMRKGSEGGSGGKEEMAMDGFDGHLRHVPNAEYHKDAPDEGDSTYGPSLSSTLGPDPKPLPGTPSTTPSTPNPNTLSPQPQGIFDTPPTLPSPSDSSPAHLAQFRRFNPSPTSTAVLSRLAKIGDHPVSPSSVGHSQGPSPVDPPDGGTGKWPLGTEAPRGEGVVGAGPEREKQGQWTTFSHTPV